MANKVLLAIVGMAGSGKSEVTAYLRTLGIPVVRFGDLTDIALQEKGLPLTQENERVFREDIRKKEGMAAYAVLARPQIDSLFLQNDTIAINGLYSWEEYTYLAKAFPGIILVHVFVPRAKRYERLGKRAVRPIPMQQCYERDVLEIEKLNKGGPIAIADYMVDNSGDNLDMLHAQIDAVLGKIGM